MNQARALALLEEVASWLVCYTLTDAEDLFQSAPEMYVKLNHAIELLEKQ